MARFDDPLDELPLWSSGAGAVRPERVPAAPAFKRAVLTAVQRIGKAGGGGRGAARGGHRARGAKAAAVRRSRVGDRRVVIKARYVTHTANGAGVKAARLHLKYVERDGVNQDGGRGQLYTASGVADGEAFLRRSEPDPHQFRFIVAPEEAGALELTAFTRALMAQVDVDLSRPLDWVAVNHYDTEHPHTHVLVRGRDTAGQILRIDPTYLAHGFRDRARALATRELGPRLAHEIEDGWRREVGQDRWTALDAQIERVAQAPAVGADPRRVALGEPGSTVPARLDRYVVGRLKHLETLGLATQRGPRDYVLDPRYREIVTALGERGDIIKRLHRAYAGAPGDYRVFDAQIDTVGLEGQLQHQGLADELHDRHFVILETPTGQRTYVQLPTEVDVAALAVGDVIRVDAKVDAWLKPADRVIAAQAAAHGGVYRPDQHVQALATDPACVARDIDALDIVQAHAKRAQRLARFGLLTPIGTGFTVPADLVAQLTARDRAHPAPRRVTVTVVERRALAAQVNARGPAWIDTVDLEAAGWRGFAAEVRAARRQRALFLQTRLGLDPAARDLTRQLNRLERATLAADHAATSGKAAQPLVPGQYSQGRLIRRLDAASGARYAVFETAQAFTLVPWRDRFQKSLGLHLTFGMQRDGTPFVHALSLGLTR